MLWSITKSEKNVDPKFEKETIDILKSCLKKIIKGSSEKFPLSGEDLLNEGYSGIDLGLTLKELEKDWIASGFSLSKGQLLEKL